jgi:AraC family transcriptional regulator
MAPAGPLLRPDPLPVEHLLFDSPLVRVATFRCPADHPLFADTGPVINPVIVFPRTAVWIQHDGGVPFVSDPTLTTLYNRGQTYRRRMLSAVGDYCDWFALAPAVLADIAAARDPDATERPDHPFTRPHATADDETYLCQRQIVERLRSDPPCDPLWLEESVVRLATRVLAHAADGSHLPPLSNRASSRAARLHRDQAEHAREILALQFRRTCSLEALAGAVGVSVFHLCRVFRRHTGLTLHAYQTELRLRHALDRLAEPGVELTHVALDVGFSSHSHFTAAFRRRFGVAPSAFGRRGRRTLRPDRRAVARGQR